VLVKANTADPSLAITQRLYELERGSTEAAWLYLRALDSGSALRLFDQLRASGSPILQDPRIDLVEAERAVEALEPTRMLAALARADAKTPGWEARFLQARSSWIRAFLAQRQGRFSEALHLFGPIEEFYRAEHYRFEEAITLRTKAVALYMSGAREDGTAAGLRSLAMLNEFGASPELVNASAYFSLIFAVNDQLGVARKSLQFSASAPDFVLRSSPVHLWARALIAAQSGDLAEASAMVDAALLFYDPPPVEMHGLKAYIYLAQDRLDEVDQHLEEWVRRGREHLGPIELAFVLCGRAEARLSAGKAQQADALLKAIPALGRTRWLSEILIDQSEIARMQGKPGLAIRLATEALRETAHDFRSNNARDAQLQLARSYKAAGEVKQAQALLEEARTVAEREDEKGRALEVRLITWDEGPPQPSRRQQELKQLEVDATRLGFLALARHAREAAAR
jgi:hypothetical protein